MKRVIDLVIRSLLGFILRGQSLIKLNDKAYNYNDILFKNPFRYSLPFFKFLKKTISWVDILKIAYCEVHHYEHFVILILKTFPFKDIGDYNFKF